MHNAAHFLGGLTLHDTNFERRLSASGQLETAATAGVAVVLAIIGIVMYEAISAGLPGLTSGDVPIWSLKVRRGAYYCRCRLKATYRRGLRQSSACKHASTEWHRGVHRESSKCRLCRAVSCASQRVRLFASALELCCGRLQWSADLPEAFVVLGYAFYIQPMLMPLLHEMPPGQLGVRLTTTAVRYVTLGACP